MTKAAIFILIVSLIRMYKLDRKYCREGEDMIEVEEFISRASLEDIIKMQHYSTNFIMSFCLMTIGSIVNL